MNAVTSIPLPSALSSAAPLEELPHCHAGDLHGVLESQEHAPAGALIRLQRQEVLSVQEDAAPGHRVRGMPHEHVRERALSRPVGPHESDDLSHSDVEVYPLENGFPRYRCLKIPYLNQLCHLFPFFYFFVEYGVPEGQARFLAHTLGAPHGRPDGRRLDLHAERVAERLRNVPSDHLFRGTAGVGEGEVNLDRIFARVDPVHETRDPRCSSGFQGLPRSSAP